MELLSWEKKEIHIYDMDVCLFIFTEVATVAQLPGRTETGTKSEFTIKQTR